MTTNATVIKIGNSNGVIIPAKLLKALRLREKDAVSISEVGGGIFIRRIEMEEPVSPFSALDRWNDEHGVEEGSVEDALAYVEAIRGGRVDKDIPQW